MVSLTKGVSSSVGMALKVVLDANVPDNDTNDFILLPFSKTDLYFDTMA